MAAKAKFTNGEVRSISTKAACLDISFRFPGTRAAAGKDTLALTDSDESLFSVTKEVFDSEELRNVYRHQQLKGRGWLRERALPSPFTKRGIYLIPIGLVQPFLDYMKNEFLPERQELIDTFLHAYESDAEPTWDAEASSWVGGGLIPRARKRLGSQFNAKDYPPASKLAGAFEVEWGWPTYAPSAAMAEAGEAALLDAKRTTSDRWAEVEKEVRWVLRAQLIGLTEKAREALTKTRPDGRPGIFKESTLENIREFLDLLPKRQIVDDSDLDAVSAEIKELLSGVDGDMLRNDELFRKTIADGFAAAKAQLDSAVIPKPKRRIVLD